jgi:hypothetical protein
VREHLGHQLDLVLGVAARVEHGVGHQFTGYEQQIVPRGADRPQPVKRAAGEPRRRAIAA